MIPKPHIYARALRPIAVAVCVCCMLAIGIPAPAQTTQQKVPVITLGRIAAPSLKNGKLTPTLTTRQEILKNGLLLADVNNCRVTQYKFTLLAPNKGFYGPIYVTGGELTDSLKNKIKSQSGPNVKIYIEDIKMNYRGNLMDANPVVLRYDE